MDSTMCWQCSQPYRMNAEKCPKCGAANGNVNLAKAIEESLPSEIAAPQQGKTPITDAYRAAMAHSSPNDYLHRIEKLERALAESQARLAAAERERDAWKWGYSYLQDRMKSIGREGWAHDCDDEIRARSEGDSHG